MDNEDSSHVIQSVAKDISIMVDKARGKTLRLVENVAEVEYWRWITGIGYAVSFLMVWLLVLTGVSCGCCGAEDKASPTLLVGMILGSLISVALWAVAMAALLVGGHGQVFVCRPLYEEPDYVALTRLLDSPGAFFKVKNNGGSGGFFSSLLYGNGTLDVLLCRVLRKLDILPDAIVLEIWVETRREHLPYKSIISTEKGMVGSNEGNVVMQYFIKKDLKNYNQR